MKEFQAIEKAIKEKKKILVSIENKTREAENKINKARCEIVSKNSQLKIKTEELRDANDSVMDAKNEAKKILTEARDIRSQANDELSKSVTLRMNASKSCEENKKLKEDYERNSKNAKEEKRKLQETTSSYTSKVNILENSNKETNAKSVVLDEKIKYADDIRDSTQAEKVKVVEAREETAKIHDEAKIILSNIKSDKKRLDSQISSVSVTERENEKEKKDLNSRSSKIFIDEREINRKKESHQRNVDAFEAYVNMIKAKEKKADEIINQRK